jgi:hypothetical protein
MGIDVGIVPLLGGYHPYVEGPHPQHCFGAETVKIMRAKAFDKDLHILDPALRYANSSSSMMSRFVQKLEHCTGESIEVLHYHLKQSKLEVDGFRIYPKYHVVVTVVVSSFMELLGNNWFANHADEMFKLSCVNALTAY